MVDVARVSIAEGDNVSGWTLFVLKQIHDNHLIPLREHFEKLRTQPVHDHNHRLLFFNGTRMMHLFRALI